MDVMLVGIFNILQSVDTNRERMVTIWTGSDQSLGVKLGRPNDEIRTDDDSTRRPGAVRRTSWRELVN
jgi:hypothetical protein